MCEKDKKIDNEVTDETNEMTEINIDEIIKENQELHTKCNEFEDRYLRIAAEYDNYRKRTLKERESLYTEAFGDALIEILPVIDNLERAVLFTDSEKVVDGLKLTLNQCGEMLKRLGIEPIDKFGEGVKFDPEYHNAVMHSEDENAGENEVAEILQKGYKKGDKVIRYAMVKVVN